jgi:hypothetical protein
MSPYRGFAFLLGVAKLTGSSMTRLRSRTLYRERGILFVLSSMPQQTVPTSLPEVMCEGRPQRVLLELECSASAGLPGGWVCDHANLLTLPRRARMLDRGSPTTQPQLRT